MYLGFKYKNDELILVVFKIIVYLPITLLNM